MDAPKYSVCFSDLAVFLGLKEEVMDKVAQIQQEEDEQNELESTASYQQKL